MKDFTVSEFIDVLNTSLNEFFPYISIIGELANLKIRKGLWVYFDLKDESGKLSFFGSVKQLNNKFEDGMLVKVSAYPRLHKNFGFNMNFYSVQPYGEGSIKKSLELLKNKLELEGIFDLSKKRNLIYPPSRIGLITSSQSAGYVDFVKIIKSRWPLLKVYLIDVLVQGRESRQQIVDAFNFFNKNKKDLDSIVLIRGGGSVEDLAVFNDELVTRTVAASNIPTLVAIGHEIDVCLAELAADMRASTPSNAAELLVPDITDVKKNLIQNQKILQKRVYENLELINQELITENLEINRIIIQKIANLENMIMNKRYIINAYNLDNILQKGFSIVRKKGEVVNSADKIKRKDSLEIQFYRGKIKVKV